MSEIPWRSMAIRSMPMPKAKPAILLGIVPDEAEDDGIDHAGAEDLEPPRLLAHPAPRPAADDALDVHLGGRLGEREVARTEPDRLRGAEGHPAEFGEQPLEVGHRDVPVDREPFHLVEHRGVRDVGVGPVDRAGRDDPDRGLHPLHRPDLDRRRVGAKDEIAGRGFDVERVLHVPRRVLRGKVEGLEVVIVALDVRSPPDGEAEAAEDGDDVRHRLGDGMPVTRHRPPPGKGDVDPLPPFASTPLLIADPGEPGVERGLELRARAVRHLADRLALLHRKRGDALQDPGDGALLPEEAAFRVEEVALGARGRDGRHPLFAEARDLLGGAGQAQTPRYARAALDRSAIARNPAGSLTARSARIFRSTSTPAFFSPNRNWL